MSTEPEKKPSVWLVVAAAIATAYGLWKVFVPGAGPESGAVFAMRLIFTGMGVVFLLVTFLRRNT